jgi:ornithine cyclodeaminase/alanine dehydrogenase-like protein (mu-crystallin family)
MDGPTFFGSNDIKNAVTVVDLLQSLEGAMIMVSDQMVNHPPRLVTNVNDKGKLGVMYGALQNPAVHGAKILSLYPDAPASGLSSHQGNFLLFDSDDGRPIAIFDADALTAIRTAAATLLATVTLAKPDPKIITVCGAGEQAYWHIRGFLDQFDTARIRVWARDEARAQQLVNKFEEEVDRLDVVLTLPEAICGADVVTTVTASKTAFLPGALLEPGQHVNLVGASIANVREIDDEGVARLSLFTDALTSSKIESGEVIEAKENGVIGADYQITEIGEVLSGRHAGRTSQNQITGYKSHGLIVQDLAAGYEIFSRS